MIRVSIAIIFLNEEKFLREAIDSVLRQTYKAWEILLLDDGSRDGSSDMARHYAGRYPEKIRYLEHDGHRNRGMSASRNLGIRHARGEYIAFLDADDVWLPEKLERQVAIMDCWPEAGMVYGSPLLWYGWTGKSEDLRRDGLQSVGVAPNRVIKPPELLALFLAKKAITPAPSDVLLRRDLIGRVNGFEEPFRNLYEDQVFFAKVCLETPVFVADECWVRHRQHAASACSIGRKTGEYHSGYPAFLNWLERYLCERGHRGEVWRALQRALWRYRHPLLYRALKNIRHRAGEVSAYARQVARQVAPATARRWLRARAEHRG